MKRPTNTEIILGLLLVVNIIVSFWLYTKVQQQDKRIQTLERNDAVKQQVDKLNDKYESLKDSVKGLFH